MSPLGPAAATGDRASGAALRAATALAGANLCAIIVTFNPDPEALRALVENIAPQLACVAVIDNGSDPDRLKGLEALLPPDRLVFRRNPGNYGHAAALNQGCRLALDRGFAWALILDQDTGPGAELVGNLAQVYAAYPAPGLIAVLSANYAAEAPARTGHLGDLPGYGQADAPRRRRGHSRSEMLDEGPDWLACTATLSSGSVVSLAAWRALGGFAEDLFIDFVDIEFCLRARTAGREIVGTRRMLMRHAFGAPSRHHCFGREPVALNYGPRRVYYRYRNLVRLTRAYARREPAYIAGCWRELARCLIMIVLFEQGRLPKLVAAARGLLTGSFGHGLQPANWARSGDGPLAKAPARSGRAGA